MNTPTNEQLIKEIEQNIREMFKLEATRNELNYALSGFERGDMTIQDYEDDLSVAISNWFVKDLLPKYQSKVTDLQPSDPKPSAGNSKAQSSLTEILEQLVYDLNKVPMPKTPQEYEQLVSTNDAIYANAKAQITQLVESAIGKPYPSVARFTYTDELQYQAREELREEIRANLLQAIRGEHEPK